MFTHFKSAHAKPEAKVSSVGFFGMEWMITVIQLGKDNE